MLQTIHSYSQFNHIITNSKGDTITFTWPFSIDSLCEKSEVIISFKPEALKLNKLCWTFLQTDQTNMLNNFNTLSEYYSFLYSEQLQVDSIIADSVLSNAIKLFGGGYFRRLSTASPYRDTISLTRYGDTIINRTYLTLLLKLNNETNMLNLCGVLNYHFLNLINFAKPKGTSIYLNNNCEFLYPNPAHDFATIMVPENIDNDFEIIIFDLLGNEIFKNIFFRSEIESNNIRVNLGDFKPDLYYICLKSTVESKFYKVLICR